MPSFVVTGAARGIGLELVRHLSQDQDNIVFALVRSMSSAVNLRSLECGNIHILEADITDVRALKLAAAEVSKVTGGKLDVLINNAAYMEEDHKKRMLFLDEYPEGEESGLEADLRKSFDVNVIGVIHTTNAFLPLIRTGQTKKVFTLSTAMANLDFTLNCGLKTLGWCPYSISKAALNMVVAKYAVEYKNEGLIFLAVCPGLVNTSTKTPTREEIEHYTNLVNTFQKISPTFKGAITPEESISTMLIILDKATIDDTGAFISHNGNKGWKEWLL